MSDIRPIFEKKSDGKRDYKSIALVLFSFLVGYTAMLLIAIYEEDILFDVDSSC